MSAATAILTDTYLLPRTERERRRLQIQAQVLEPMTEALLVRAVIAPGMRVLDIGCGVGDVSLIAARLVGSTGTVVGVDIDEAALATARERARQHGFDQVSFQLSDICEDAIAGSFDAVIGRHILIHMENPAQVLARAAGMLRPGGVAAFHEYDGTIDPPVMGEPDLFTRTSAMGRNFVRRMAKTPDMGSKLPKLLAAAGLEASEARTEFAVDDPGNSLTCEWLAESIRSVAPHLEKLGLATAEELDVDTLAERLRQERDRTGVRHKSFAIVGAFGRKPTAS
jgi:ubiquinone/menaquinone biosynthesis C-methylase UbiE